MFLLRLIQSRPFHVLALAVGVWLIVPVVGQRLARASFFEFGAPADIAASYARDLQKYWGLRTRTKDELLKAAQELADLNAKFESSVQETESLRADVERLEEILRLPSYPEYRMEAARVVRRDFATWWQRITIRKGRNYGIPLHAPVIFGGGVVGRVIEVHATTAVVDLVSSPTLRITAEVEGDDRPFSYQGGPNPPFAAPHGSVEFVPTNIDPKTSAATRIVTTGLGGIFPPGLTIGHIEKLENSTDGLFQNGTVLLDTRLSSLVEVAVLVPIGPPQP